MYSAHCFAEGLYISSVYRLFFQKFGDMGHLCIVSSTSTEGGGKVLGQLNSLRDLQHAIYPKPRRNSICQKLRANEEQIW